MNTVENSFADLTDVFPIKSDMIDFYDFLKKITATVWRHTEVLGSGDRHAYLVLDDRVKSLYIFFLKFLNSIDDIVGANWSCIVPKHIRSEFIINAIKSFIEYIETEHAFTYKKFISEFLDDPIERTAIFKSFMTFGPVLKLQEYSKKYIRSTEYKYPLFANLLIEHVLLPVIFTFVSWTAEKTVDNFNKRVPGFVQANTMIMADEATHADFAIMILNKYSEIKPPRDEALIVAREFMSFIEECNAEAFSGVNVPGINADILNDVARAKINELFIRLGLGDKVYDIGSLPGYALNNNLMKKESNFETNATIYSRVDKTDWSTVTNSLYDF